MIGELLHNVDFDATSFTTKLTLIRAGINGTEITGLTKTRTGKVLA